jgi:hypothetical protein
MIQHRGGDISTWCRISGSIKSRNSLTTSASEKFSRNALHHKNIFQNFNLTLRKRMNFINVRRAPEIVLNNLQQERWQRLSFEEIFSMNLVQ